jgi:hypothetical protein
MLLHRSQLLSKEIVRYLFHKVNDLFDFIDKWGAYGVHFYWNK